MPTGPAGFDRPLVKSEMVVETALNVASEYGERLEGNSFRAEQETEMEKMLHRMRGGASDDVYPIELSPAGYTVGVKVAVGKSLYSQEPNSRGVTIDDLENFFTRLPKEFSQVNGFVIPTAYDSFGEPTNKPVYAVNIQ